MNAEELFPEKRIRNPVHSQSQSELLTHLLVTHVQYRLAHRILLQVTLHGFGDFNGFPGKRHNLHRAYPMREHLSGQIAKPTHPRVVAKCSFVNSSKSVTAGVGNRGLRELLHILHLPLLAFRRRIQPGSIAPTHVAFRIAPYRTVGSPSAITVSGMRCIGISATQPTTSFSESYPATFRTVYFSMGMLHTIPNTAVILEQLQYRHVHIGPSA